MKLKNMISALILVFVLSLGIALAAKPDLTQALASVNPSNGKAIVAIPSNAIEVSPGVFSLGTAVDNGNVVEGYAIVDYKKGFGRQTGNAKAPGTSCYGFLANGAKWKTLEPYLVNTLNNDGLSDEFVRANLASDIAKWETAAGKNIIGGETTGIVDGADTASPDNKNEVYFADISDSGAIGVTIVWGIFSGPPRQRMLVEWDQVYDDFDFDWSADCLAEDCTSKMDFENIATHELGHTVGLSDLYTTSCAEETMYGYASNGETKKRSLENGDKLGIATLYK